MKTSNCDVLGGSVVSEFISTGCSFSRGGPGNDPTFPLGPQASQAGSVSGLHFLMGAMAGGVTLWLLCLCPSFHRCPAFPLFSFLPHLLHSLSALYLKILSCLPTFGMASNPCFISQTCDFFKDGKVILWLPCLITLLLLPKEYHPNSSVWPMRQVAQCLTLV